MLHAAAALHGRARVEDLAHVARAHEVDVVQRLVLALQDLEGDIVRAAEREAVRRRIEEDGVVSSLMSAPMQVTQLTSAASLTSIVCRRGTARPKFSRCMVARRCAWVCSHCRQLHTTTGAAGEVWFSTQHRAPCRSQLVHTAASSQTQLTFSRRACRALTLPDATFWAAEEGPWRKASWTPRTGWLVACVDTW